jgi:antirestriction protein ArdC
VLLWSIAQERGYQRNTWLTYKQADALGGQVRRGERGAMVVYAGQQAPEEAVAADGDAAADTRQRQAATFLRSYTVFNVEQVDGLTAFEPALNPVTATVTLDEPAEAFFAATRARIQHGGSRAFYAPGADMVQLPEPSAFKSTHAYAATKAHVLAHWTGHPKRLAREFGRRFGDAAYAMEELVAELCAAFVCADLRIATEPRDDHAPYLAEWLRVLRGDSRAIFTAATHAQRAADYLHGCQGGAHV